MLIFFFGRENDAKDPTFTGAYRGHKVSRSDQIPSDNERIFSTFHNGTWFQRAQELVGPDNTVGSIMFYSDKTTVLNNTLVYPLYSKFHPNLGVCALKYLHSRCIPENM